MRQVIIFSGEDGMFVAEVPSLPGCVSQGRTHEEALANTKDAIEGFIRALQDNNMPVPEDRGDAQVVLV